MLLRGAEIPKNNFFMLPRGAETPKSNFSYFRVARKRFKRDDKRKPRKY